MWSSLLMTSYVWCNHVGVLIPCLYWSEDNPIIFSLCRVRVNIRDRSVYEYHIIGLTLMEKKKPRNLTIALVSKSRLRERRTPTNKNQETIDRRHSTGCRRGSDTGNLINFGEDLLLEKMSVSDWNLSEKSIFKGKRNEPFSFMSFIWIQLFRKSVPLTIKDLVVESDVYSGIIHAYSDIFSNHSITYWSAELSDLVSPGE